jgi:hypothetical protein
MLRFAAAIQVLILLTGLAALAGCHSRPDGDVVLYDFENDSDLDRLNWKCRVLYALSPQHATHGGRSLRMDLYPSAYPGLSPRLSRHDWRGFEALCLDVFNPTEKALFITVRIDDKKDYPDYRDRYNHRFAIQPGMNNLRIPIAGLITSGTHRQLNAGTIERFMFFMVNPAERHTLFVDYIRLCRQVSR